MRCLPTSRTTIPDYDAKAGYEIAGFVWFQGFNDQFAPEYRDNYKDNMVHFINDVRKEYKTPNMPFVIGVLGTPGPRKRLMKMQSPSLSAKRQSILSSKAMYSPLRATRTTPTTLTQFLKKAGPNTITNGTP